MFSVSCCSRSSLGHAKPAEEMGALSAGDGGLWSSYCAALAWICKRAEFIGWVGFALLPGDSSGWVTRCFSRDFQKKSMPPPWRGRNSPSTPLPSARRVRRWAHLVFGDEGFDLINILWHGLLVPLDQGCLSPLDPSQELFQKLCICHQLGKRRLQSLLVLLRPRENLLETQRRLSAQHGETRGRNRHHAAVLRGGVHHRLSPSAWNKAWWTHLLEPGSDDGDPVFDRGDAVGMAGSQDDLPHAHRRVHIHSLLLHFLHELLKGPHELFCNTLPHKFCSGCVSELPATLCASMRDCNASASSGSAPRKRRDCSASESHSSSMCTAVLNSSAYGDKSIGVNHPSPKMGCSIHC